MTEKKDKNLDEEESNSIIRPNKRTTAINVLSKQILISRFIGLNQVVVRKTLNIEITGGGSRFRRETD